MVVGSFWGERMMEYYLRRPSGGFVCRLCRRWKPRVEKADGYSMVCKWCAGDD